MPTDDVHWHPDDGLVIEVQHAAKQLGFDFRDTISFLVGMGIASAQEQGLLGARALKPMDHAEMLRRLAEYLEVDPNAR